MSGAQRPGANVIALVAAERSEAALRSAHPDPRQEKSE
jgi:hypothetical protein